MLDLIPYLAGSAQAASGSTTLVITVGSNGGWPVIAGDRVIVAGGIGSAVPTGVTDSQGHTYTAQVSTATNPASWIFTALASHGLQAAGQGVTTADTITVTWAATTQNKTAIALGCGGLVTASVVDGGATPAAVSGSSNAPSVTTGTFGQAGELVVAVLSNAAAGGSPNWAGNNHQAWANGWTVIDTRTQGSNGYTSVACTQARGTTAKTASAAISSTSWTMCAVALKQSVNLRGRVGLSLFGSTYDNCGVKLGEFQAAQTADGVLGRKFAEDNGFALPLGKRYYGEGNYPDSSGDSQSVVSLWNSHNIVIAPSFKPFRKSVTDSTIRASEVAKFKNSLLFYRNNGWPGAVVLWQEVNYGGKHGPFGDGTVNSTNGPDNPWANQTWTDQQSGDHYKSYAQIFAPIAQSAGVPVWFDPLVASVGDISVYYPGRDLTNALVFDYYWISDYHTGGASAAVGKGNTLNTKQNDGSPGPLDMADAETPPLPCGMGEIGPSDAANQTFPSANNPTSGYVDWFNTFVKGPFTARLAAGKQNVSFLLYSGHCDGPGRIVGASNPASPAGPTPAAVISAYQGAYDALDPSAGTTGVAPVFNTASPLPAGTVGVSYSSRMSATGAAPLTFAVTSGQLPAGLAMDTGGLISGTPSAAVTRAPVITVTDGNGLTASGTFSITIAGSSLAVPPQSLPSGTAGQAYAAQLSETGGTAPYTWAVLSGTLPAGLALAAGGNITGTPAAAGTSSFTPQVTDSLAATASPAAPFTITIAAAALSVTTGSLPGGVQGTAYTATLAATGGTTPYTWALNSGALPAGLALNSTTGVISGTPSAAGTSSFTVRVTDAAARTAASGTLAITVTATALLTVTTSSLPPGTAGNSYTATLAAANGTTPYTWAITAGALPGGLSLASSTGVISGTITGTATGTFSFTVRVTDSAAHTATAPLSVVISAAPFTITTTALPGGFLDAFYTGEIDETGGTGTITWAVTSGSLPPGLSLAVAAPADTSIEDEAGGPVTDEAGGVLLDES